MTGAFAKVTSDMGVRNNSTTSSQLEAGAFLAQVSEQVRTNLNGVTARAQRYFHYAHRLKIRIEK